LQGGVGGVHDGPERRFDFQTFDWEQFIAASRAIRAPDRQELDWAAWAPGWDEEQSSYPSDFMPLGFLLYGEANEDCCFDAADIATGHTAGAAMASS
jgi:hypothetical protein